MRIVDTNPPNVINPPQSMTFTVPIGTPCQVVTWPEPTATDDSGVPPTVRQTHPSGDCFPVGVTQVDYLFTDPSGNAATASFTITGKCNQFLCTCLHISAADDSQIANNWKHVTKLLDVGKSSLKAKITP